MVSVRIKHAENQVTRKISTLLNLDMLLMLCTVDQTRSFLEVLMRVFSTKTCNIAEKSNKQTHEMFQTHTQNYNNI